MDADAFYPERNACVGNRTLAFCYWCLWFMIDMWKSVILENQSLEYQVIHSLFKLCLDFGGLPIYHLLIQPLKQGYMYLPFPTPYSYWFWNDEVQFLVDYFIFQMPNSVGMIGTTDSFSEPVYELKSILWIYMINLFDLFPFTRLIHLKN